MKRVAKVVLLILLAGMLLLSVPAWQLFVELQKARSEDPTVWEENIAALEEKSAGRCQPGECILFVGSSSIRFWDTLAEDMAPMPVLQHGFGGAKLNDLVYYAHRLVSAWEPRAVVVFAGTNDIDPTATKAPGVLLASYQSLVKKIRADLPGVPIYYIGITPSVMRWSVWPIARETNDQIAAWSATGDRLHFIDTSPGLMGDNGEPLRDNYILDGLHLSERGYRVWRDAIRPRLINDLYAGVEEAGTGDE